MRVRGLSFKFIDKQMDEFNAQVQSAMKAVVQDGIIRGESAADVSLDDLNSIPSRWTRELDNGILAAALGYFLAAANEQAENVGTALTSAAEVAPEFAEYTIASEDESARAYLAGARNRLVGIGNELWSNARQELVAGMESGEGIPQLTKRVQASAGVTAKRARVIARTEVVGASNAGSIAVMRQLGEVAKKEWINTHDGRTRPTHITAGGQTVDLNDRFQVGASSLDHPGDPAGAAKEVINCRCTMGYELNEDDPINPVPQMPQKTEVPPKIVALEIGPNELKVGDEFDSPTGGGRAKVTRVSPGPNDQKTRIDYDRISGVKMGEPGAIIKQNRTRMQVSRRIAANEAPPPVPKLSAPVLPPGVGTAKILGKALRRDQYDALTRGGVQGADRRRAFAAQGEFEATLAQVVDDFSYGAGNILPDLRKQIVALKSGVDDGSALAQGAKALATAINSSPPELAPTLFRGMAVKGTAEEAAAKYAVGSPMNFNLGSFTSDMTVAEEFAEDTMGRFAKGKSTQVILTVRGPKHALPIEHLVDDGFTYQKEWISGGDFIITGSRVEDGVLHLDLKQKDRL